VRICFVTLGAGSAGWNLAAKRLEIEAKFSKRFDEVYNFKIKDLKLLTPHDRKFIQTNKKGLGYWLWKPYTILQAIHNSNKSELFWYADAGCDINPGHNSKGNFLKIIQQAQSKEALFFQSKYNEIDFSKEVTRKYFHEQYNLVVENNDKQIVATSFILKRNFAIELCQEWIQTMKIDDYNLLRDSTNLHEEHRHDQSILSLLIKTKLRNGISNYVSINNESLIDYIPNAHPSNANKFLICSRNRTPIPYLWRRKLNKFGKFGM
jgi:hypothetical protein